MMPHCTAVLYGYSGSIRKTLITYDRCYRAHKKQDEMQEEARRSRQMIRDYPEITELKERATNGWFLWIRM
jgi:hypothetical protein